MAKFDIWDRCYKGTSYEFPKEYVDAELKKHREAAPIEHPDGSVTVDKLASGSVTDIKIGSRTADDPASDGNGESFTGVLTAWLERITAAVRGGRAALAAHGGDHENPHAVTKAQVGLGNAENTADVDKPLSDAAIAALAEKVDQLDATVNAAADKIPRAGGDGKIALGWIPALGSKYAPIKDMRGEEMNDLTGSDFLQTGIYRVYADGPEGEGDYILFVMAMETGYIATQTISKGAGDECGVYQRKVKNILELETTPWGKIIDSLDVSTGAAPDKIPRAGGDGKIALGWIPALGSKYAPIKDMRGEEMNDLTETKFLMSGLYKVWVDEPDGEGDYVLSVAAIEEGFIAIQTITKNTIGECNVYQRKVEVITVPDITPWRKVIVDNDIVNGGQVTASLVIAPADAVNKDGADLVLTGNTQADSNAIQTALNDLDSERGAGTGWVKIEFLPGNISTTIPAQNNPMMNPHILFPEKSLIVGNGVIIQNSHPTSFSFNVPSGEVHNCTFKTIQTGPSSGNGGLTVTNGNVHNCKVDNDPYALGISISNGNAYNCYAKEIAGGAGYFLQIQTGNAYNCGIGLIKNDGIGIKLFNGSAYGCHANTSGTSYRAIEVGGGYQGAFYCRVMGDGETISAGFGIKVDGNRCLAFGNTVYTEDALVIGGMATEKHCNREGEDYVE